MNRHSSRVTSNDPSGRWRVATAAATLAAFLAGNAWSFQRVVDANAPAAATGQAAVAASAEIPTDRLIIKLRAQPAGVAAAAAAASSLPAVAVAANRAGVRVSPLRTMSGDNTHVMQLDRRMDPESLRRLAQDIQAGDRTIEYVEPDRILRPQWLPNDMFLVQQWHYTEPKAGINLPSAWDLTRGKGVVVGVIDTGVRLHADLAANLLPGYDFISLQHMANDGDGRDADASDPGDWAARFECGLNPPSISSWHGTHVAGTIAALANNSHGGAGVAPEARILPLRALGRCGGYESDIADAIVWGAGGSVAGLPSNPNPAKVLNLSLGAAGTCSRTTQAAVHAARDRGAVVVVAAGNAKTDAGQFTPASCLGVISVAAVGRSGALASYSNFGPSVTLAAPGGDGLDGVFSTADAGLTLPLADSYRTYTGTSMAAPHVSGTVALMLAWNPALTPNEIETVLKSTAAARGFPVACGHCGSGIVDARAAVEAAGRLSPTPPTVPPRRILEVEPNDWFAPQPLPSLPAVVEGRLNRRSDDDSFTVDLPAGKTLKATLTPNSLTNFGLVASDGLGTWVTSGVTGAGEVDIVRVTNKHKWPMKVKLGVINYWRDDGIYTLEVQVE